MTLLWCDTAERLACCAALRKGSVNEQADLHQQWRCGFCGDLCCKQTSATEASAMLRLADDSAAMSVSPFMRCLQSVSRTLPVIHCVLTPAVDSADVEAEAAAVAPLLGGCSPQEFYAWPADRQAAQLAAVAGAAVVASLYHLPMPPNLVALATVADAGVRLGCTVLRLEAAVNL